MTEISTRLLTVDCPTCGIKANIENQPCDTCGGTDYEVVEE